MTIRPSQTQLQQNKAIQYIPEPTIELDYRAVSLSVLIKEVRHIIKSTLHQVNSLSRTLTPDNSAEAVVDKLSSDQCQNSENN